MNNGEPIGNLEATDKLKFYLIAGDRWQRLQVTELEMLYNSPALSWRDGIYRLATMKYIDDNIRHNSVILPKTGGF